MRYTKSLLVTACILSLLFGYPAAAQQAPSFALLNSKGAMVYKTELRGNLIISFFASYCRPCEKELPALAELVKRYGKDKNLSFVLIATDVNDRDGKASDKAGRFLRNIGLDHEFLIDMYHIVISKYNPRKSIPSTFLVNSGGRIVFKETGVRDDTIARLEKAILKLN